MDWTSQLPQLSWYHQENTYIHPKMAASYLLICCRRTVIETGANPLSAVQLYSPKSPPDCSGTTAWFCLVFTVLNLVPSGLYQNRVGVGTPSDLQVTVWPIQDLDTEEVTSSMVAGSVDEVAKQIIPSYIILQSFTLLKQRLHKTNDLTTS